MIRFFKRFFVLLLMAAVCLGFGCHRGEDSGKAAPVVSSGSSESSGSSGDGVSPDAIPSLAGGSPEDGGDRSAILIIRQDAGNEGSIPVGSVFEAVVKGNREGVKGVLKENPDLIRRKNASDYGRTPLHYAVIFENGEMANLLIASGADVNARDDEFQRSPLHYAAISGNCAIASKLIAAGAKTDCEAFNAWTPLHEASMQGWAEMISLLVSSGADVSIDDEIGRTPLHYAALYGRQAAVKVLIEKGAETGVSDNRKQTPLHLAAIYGDKETAALLLEKGTKPGAVDSEGHTAAYYAKKNGKNDIYEILAKAGASNGNTPEAEVRTPAAVPSDIRQEVKKKSDEKSVLSIIIRGNRGEMERFFPSGGKVNMRDGEGMTPLHTAVIHSGTETAEILINKGARINEADNYGRTPLHYAAMYVKADMANLLLKKGADPNIRDKEGKTALCMGYSGSQDNSETVNALIKAGCRTNLSDNNGWTPLHWASFYGKNEVVRILLRAKADPLAKNKAGQTPLEMINSKSIPQPWLYGEIRDVLQEAERRR